MDEDLKKKILFSNWVKILFSFGYKFSASNLHWLLCQKIEKREQIIDGSFSKLLFKTHFSLVSMKTSILWREPVKLGDKNTWCIRMLSTRDTKFKVREKMNSRIKFEKHFYPIIMAAMINWRWSLRSKLSMF